MAQLFPRSANRLPVVTLFGALGGGALVIFLVWYYFSPEFYEVGYMPTQPVPYSHELHVGQLGMDCRYCHGDVEKSSVSIPAFDADVHELPRPDPDAVRESPARARELGHR
jgi:hypothetical protein